jgi:hypothetical protein
MKKTNKYFQNNLFYKIVASPCYGNGEFSSILKAGTTELTDPIFEFPNLKSDIKKEGANYTNPVSLGQNVCTIIGFGPVGAHLAEIYRAAGLAVVAASRSQDTADKINGNKIAIRYTRNSSQKEFVRNIPDVEAFCYEDEDDKEWGRLSAHILDDSRVALTLPECAYTENGTPSKLIKKIMEAMEQRYRESREVLHLDVVLNKPNSRKFIENILGNALSTGLNKKEMLKSFILTTIVENRKGSVSKDGARSLSFLSSQVFELYATEGMKGLPSVIVKTDEELKIYEKMKNRVSNGLHAGLAALAADEGIKTIAAAMQNKGLYNFIQSALEDIAIATFWELAKDQMSSQQVHSFKQIRTDINPLSVLLKNISDLNITTIPYEEILKFGETVALREFKDSGDDPVSRVARNSKRKVYWGERLAAPCVNFKEFTGNYSPYLLKMLLAELLCPFSWKDTDLTDEHLKKDDELPMIRGSESSPSSFLLSDTGLCITTFLTNYCGFSAENPQALELAAQLEKMYADLSPPELAPWVMVTKRKKRG